MGVSHLVRGGVWGVSHLVRGGVAVKVEVGVKVAGWVKVEVRFGGGAGCQGQGQGQYGRVSHRAAAPGDASTST